MARWTPAELTLLGERWQTMNCPELGRLIGHSAAAVRNKKYELGLVDVSDNWTSEQLDLLRCRYAETMLPLHLSELADELGKTRVAVELKASRLGITTGHHRRRVEHRKPIRKYESPEAARQAVGPRMRQWRQEHPNFKPAAGLHHTAATKELCGLRAKQMWETFRQNGTGLMSEASRRARSDRLSQRRRSGDLCETRYSRAKGGKRADLDNRYFRSRWEANFARYLNFLVGRGELHRWEYESETFWFEHIKRGTRSYTPDFKVWETPEAQPVFYEVKGWDYEKGRVARERLARHYPDVKLILVDTSYYRQIAKLSGLLPGWETDKWGG